MNKKLQKFLQDVNLGRESVNAYPLPGIIDHCDEWITEGWEARNDAITPPMYAAALFNEASTQDECVKSGDSHKDYPVTLRLLALKILELAGHGTMAQVGLNPRPVFCVKH